MTDFAIYIDGEFVGVNIEAARELIEKAVAHGVKTWQKKDVMAIQFGAIWLEGYMEAAQFCNETKEVLRKAINDFYFI